MGMPNTPDEWLTVASERASDADAMLATRENSNGPVYMAGWAIECALNGLLVRRHIRRPRPGSGEAHHDLRQLWKAAGLQLGDLTDPTGHKAWLLKSWGPHLRYETEYALPGSNVEIVQAARHLTGFLHKLARRPWRK